MHKRTKLWASISAVTFAGVTSLTGYSSELEQSAAVSTEVSAPSISSNGEGEGTSNLAIDLKTNDLAYLTQLGLIRGHLYVGHKLYMNGHIDHAKTHMKHPESELYADIIPAFAARQTSEFGQALQNLATTVNDDMGFKEVDAAYQALLSQITVTESAVSPTSQSPTEKLKLAAALLHVAGEEYAIAVVDGKMENAHEYQDALGFTTVARALVDQLDSDVDTQTRAAGLLDSIKPLWPSLIPPSTLKTDAGEIYGVAAKIELLALSL